MDSKELSSILDCFGDQKAIKTLKLNTIWLELIARVLNMLIELKGDDYYSKMLKRVNYKLLNNTFWVVISDQFRNIVSNIDHIESQPSTSSDRLFVVHNTPQVQIGVEHTLTEVQPITEDQPVIEVPQAVDNVLVDQVDQELHDTSELQVEPHTFL